VPGRFNLLEAEGVQIIVDYGHNPAALHALGEAAAALGPRPTTVAFTLPGDRRDQDLVDSTLALLPFVDRWVLYESEDLRGRAPGEMPKLAAGALPPGTDVQCVPDQRSAVEQAWRQVGPGERLILIADEVEPAFEMLREVIGLSDEDMTCEVTLPNGWLAAEAEQTVQLA
jgi:cyanophycin synthetase